MKTGYCRIDRVDMSYYQTGEISMHKYSNTFQICITFRMSDLMLLQSKHCGNNALIITFLKCHFHSCTRIRYELEYWNRNKYIDILENYAEDQLGNFKRSAVDLTSLEIFLLS